jgi:hypothetical protein
MKGSEPDIAAAGGVPAFLLKMTEECTEERGIEIRDRERRWRFFQALLGKREEQTKGVPIACNGVRACPPLVAKTVGEECLK